MFEFHRNERARQLRPSLSRSWLLVRANASEDVFEQAFESEADSIIIDLEDGCPPEEKDAAREQVVRMLNSGVVAWVRINAITTEHWWKDVKALKNVKGLRGVMLATTEHATDIDRTSAELPAGTPIIALIESALGVHHSVEIARAIGTFRLAFGAGDYRRDTGSSATPMALAYVRSQLVIASTLGGLPGPHRRSDPRRLRRGPLQGLRLRERPRHDRQDYPGYPPGRDHQRGLLAQRG